MILKFSLEKQIMSDRKYINVSRPNIVKVYNKHMGGVDLLDPLLGYYRNKIRSKKWYLRIFFHLIDMTTVNAWILWNQHNPENKMALRTSS